jgi:chloramphenicol-sensitive protein RarD
VNIDPKPSSSAGLLAGIFAFLLWGLVPLYWKQIQEVAADEILSHRVFWSLAFVAGMLTCTSGWPAMRRILRQPRIVGWSLLSGSLIAVNWFVFIWAVNSGNVVETSLGYYMGPLASVALGALVLGERLRPIQLLAVILAAVGVIWLTLGYDHFPWIALALCISFALYGLIRKIAPTNSLDGLFLETAMLTPVAAILIGWRLAFGQGAFLLGGWKPTLFLFFAGLITALPLLGFAFAARRLPLTTVGVLQYLAPTTSFLLGVFLYREPFTTSHLITFSFIWAALILYTGESLFRSVRKPAKLDPALERS